MRPLHTNRILILLASVIAFSVMAVACGGGKETDPVKLVPDGSTFIAQINLGAILASDSFATLFAALPKDDEGPQTLDEQLDEAVAETGVDLRQLSQLAFFADLSRTEEFSATVVRGTFDEIEVISAFSNARESRLGTSNYKGRLLYTAEDESGVDTLAMLEGENLVVGTMEAVRAVIDVQDGDRERLSGEILDKFNDLGLGLIRLELDISTSDFVQRFPALGEIPLLGDGIESLPGVMEALQDLRLVGLSLSQNGQILVLRANLDFANEESASDIGDFLDGIVKLMAALSPDTEVQGLLNQIEVSSNRSRATFRVEMTSSEFGQLVTALVGIASSETAVIDEEPTQPQRAAELGDEVALMPTKDHVPEGQTVIYSTTPPTSGDHWARWAECGFYEDGLPDELITHNLEHGNIVVSYNFASQQEINKLRETMDSIKLADEWGVTRFYNEIPEGQIAVAAWGRLYTAQNIDRDQIAMFFADYAGKRGPERIACLDGLGHRLPGSTTS